MTSFPTSTLGNVHHAGYHNCGRMWCDYNRTTHCCAVGGHLCCASILEEGHFNVCYNMSMLSFLCVLVLLGESEQAPHR